MFVTNMLTQCVILNANILRVAYSKYSAYLCRIFSPICRDTARVMANTVVMVWILVLLKKANKFLILFETSRPKFLSGFSTAFGDFWSKTKSTSMFSSFACFLCLWLQ